MTFGSLVFYLKMLVDLRIKQLGPLNLISKKSCNEVILQTKFDPEEDQVMFPPNICSFSLYIHIKSNYSKEDCYVAMSVTNEDPAHAG